MDSKINLIQQENMFSIPTDIFAPVLSINFTTKIPWKIYFFLLFKTSTNPDFSLWHRLLLYLKKTMLKSRNNRCFNIVSQVLLNEFNLK